MSRTSAPSGQRSLDLLEKWAVLRLFVAVGHHVEDGRRIRRAHQLEEEGGAVGVAPLSVVDVDDERLPGGERPEERPERGERAPPDEVRIGDRLLGDLADARHAPQNGEHARESADVGRQVDRLPLLLEVDQVTAEGVDHAVDGLVRDRFALVGATAQAPAPRRDSTSPSRKCAATADLPMPDAPPTRTVTARPERTCSNASRRAASCVLASDEFRVRPGPPTGSDDGTGRRLCDWSRGASGSPARSVASRGRDRGARGTARRARRARPRRTRRAAPGRATSSS